MSVNIQIHTDRQVKTRVNRQRVTDKQTDREGRQGSSSLSTETRTDRYKKKDTQRYIWSDIKTDI